VLLDANQTAPARFEVLETTREASWVRVVLREGKNRQIRRMVAQVGLGVSRLIRVRIGSLGLGDLPSGAWRRLSEEQIAELRGPRV
jgi:pseudouridine synthase